MAAVTLQQFVNEPTGLETVQLPDPDAEPFLCEGFDVVFIELVLADDLLDELALLGRAGPGAGIGLALVGLAVPAGPVVPVGGRVHSIGGSIWQKPDFLNLAIHRILCQGVEAFDLPGDLGEIGNLRLYADTALVAAEVGQPQLFGIR
jgi:hypothetical protein